MTAEQGSGTRTTKQPRTDPVEPALALAAAQIARRTMGAEAIGQFAQQVEQGPGRDHHQQLRQERLFGTQELRQEGGEEQDVFRVARAQHERTPEQCAKAWHRCCLWHFSAV